jgi:hypothetical protein
VSPPESGNAIKSANMNWNIFLNFDVKNSRDRLADSRRGLADRARSTSYLGGKWSWQRLRKPVSASQAGYLSRFRLPRESALYGHPIPGRMSTDFWNEDRVA